MKQTWFVETLLATPLVAEKQYDSDELPLAELKRRMTNQNHYTEVDNKCRGQNIEMMDTQYVRSMAINGDVHLDIYIDQNEACDKTSNIDAESETSENVSFSGDISNEDGESCKLLKNKRKLKVRDTN